MARRSKEREAQFSAVCETCEWSEWAPSLSEAEDRCLEHEQENPTHETYVEAVR